MSNMSIHECTHRHETRGKATDLCKTRPWILNLRRMMPRNLPGATVAMLD